MKKDKQNTKKVNIRLSDVNLSWKIYYLLGGGRWEGFIKHLVDNYDNCFYNKNHSDVSIISNKGKYHLASVLIKNKLKTTTNRMMSRHSFINQSKEI